MKKIRITITTAFWSLLISMFCFQSANAQVGCFIDTASYTIRVIQIWGETNHLMRQTDTTGYGVKFRLNDSLTIYGFEFFATVLSLQDDTVQVAANLYTSDTNGFPDVLLATDTVNIDTASAVFPDVYGASRVATFPAPVALGDSFVLIIEALVDSTILIDFTVDNPFVNIATPSFLYAGTWGNLSDSILVPNTPDFRPIVQYDIQAGFTVDSVPVSLGDTVYACTSQVLSFGNISNSIFFNNMFIRRLIDAGDPVRWEWGDGTPYGNNTTGQNHSYALTGFYRMVMIDTVEGYTFPGFCLDSNEVIIQVDSVPPIPNFGYANISDTTFLVAFYDSSIFSGTYVWYFGDGDSATGANPVHLYPDTGTYTVRQKVYNGCDTNSSVKLITVTCDTLPTAAFTYGYLGSGSFQFTNGSSNAKSYSWDFGDASFSPAVNPTHGYLPGTYDVILTAANDCGSVQDTQTINYTGINEKDLIRNAIKIYPNPNEGSFEVSLSVLVGEDSEITISDVLGKIIYEKQVSFNNSDKVKFDLSGYNSGLYFINVVSYKGSFYQKIVIE